MIAATCQHCGEQFRAQRRTRKFCSSRCANRTPYITPQERKCRHCGEGFLIHGSTDANRQHCSKSCAKNHNAKRIKAWNLDHPEAGRGYARAVVQRNPQHHKEHAGKQRDLILALLGGACIVCGVTNKHWLHVDFIRGSRGLKYRHPRHLAYVQANQAEFRLLCANHHYELTLTGKIEGTDIVQ